MLVKDASWNFQLKIKTKMASGTMDLYEQLIGEEFTGQFKGRKLVKGNLPKAVFKVNRHGNDRILRLFDDINNSIDKVLFKDMTIYINF